ncbi:MAG: hypothetical protein P9L89_08350 [Candidatus Celaenobacter polaris]|nr:hypothetical protein [Candidatus Celaenobacter polaris]
MELEDAMKGDAIKRVIIYLWIGVLFLAGCDSSIDYAMKMYMRDNTDRVEILFYAGPNYKGMKPILAQTFMDRENMERVLSFITKKLAEFYKGEYSGEIIFLKGANSALTERMKFNIEPGCEHILYMFNRELYSRKISKKGLVFLRELDDRVIK